MSPLAAPRVVLLVDDRNRDLLQAALIAHHLGALGVETFLEPLEAYRAVLAAYRPGLIVFNHLTASHLAAYSRRLHDLGILTAVLTNEGILYDPDTLRFNAGRFHSGAHIDLFFCWNQAHRQALLESGAVAPEGIRLVGVPRFDFYVAPWSRLVARPRQEGRPRPRLLFCTNFVTAKYWELPREHGDKFFSPWKGRVPLYTDYWPAIEAHFRGRQRILEFLAAAARDGRYDLTLRPHPREGLDFYRPWWEGLPSAARERIRLDASSNITELILDCDLEISVETCTTALEAWIAGKPTLEIALDRHPLWHRQVQSRCAVICDRPEGLVPAIQAALTTPAPPDILARRAAHLRTWCGEPDGTSALRVARAIVGALEGRPAPDWGRLDLSDRRRAWKLGLLRRLGLPYQYDPALPLKRLLAPGRYAIKALSYRKSIRPADVRQARARVDGCAAPPEPDRGRG